jgi:hypothetical protein
MTRLGKLERVDLRTAWATEDRDFTPWLAEEQNLEILSHTLGIDLEHEATEKDVGPFRADILCKNRGNGDWVLIENQLERTDHTHLGQLITYAAGLEAVTIVWISSQFTDEHRAALNWLNQMTEETIRFFGLEVELWKIGHSAPAPKFNVIAQPNDWSSKAKIGKRSIENTALSPSQQLQLDYWTGVAEALKQCSGNVKPVKPSKNSWISHGIGRSGFGVNVAMCLSKEWVRVELYLSGQAANDNFQLLLNYREDVERELGEKLDWQPLENKKNCRVCLVGPGFDPNDESSWPEQHIWIASMINQFHQTFQPIVLGLDK